MAETNRTIEFKAPLEHGSIDDENGVISGVCLCTANVKAKGYDLHTDGITLEQMRSSGESKGKTLVRARHGGGVHETVGWADGLRIVGNKLLGDLHLLSSCKDRAHYLEIARVMPSSVGLSAAFTPPEKEVKIGGKKMARCEDLVAVDFAAVPAACPSGLFDASDSSLDVSPQRKTSGEAARMESGRVDTPPGAMNEPTLKQIFDLVTKQSETIATLTQEVGEVKAAQQAAGNDDGNDEPLTADEWKEISQMSDEDLKEIGVDRASIQAAIIDAEAAEAEAAQEADAATKNAVTDPNADAATTGKAAAAPAAVAAAGATTGLSALEKRVIELEARLEKEQTDKLEAEQLTQFATIEQALVSLSAENDALRTKLKERSGAAVPGGVRVDAIGFSVPKNGAHKPGSFEALVELEVKNNKISKGDAITKVAREHPKAHADYEVRLGVAENPDGDDGEN